MLEYILLTVSNLIFLLLGYFIGTKQIKEVKETVVEKVVQAKEYLEGDIKDAVYTPPSDYKERDDSDD